MTERKYALKYDMSDGQTDLTAGSFSVWDGDDGLTLTSSGHYDIAWGYPELEKVYQYNNRIDYEYDNDDPDTEFDPRKFSALVLETGNYYRCHFDCGYSSGLGGITCETETYIGKDGDDASGKNGTYIKAIRVEAA